MHVHSYAMSQVVYVTSQYPHTKVLGILINWADRSTWPPDIRLWVRRQTKSKMRPQTSTTMSIHINYVIKEFVLKHDYGIIILQVGYCCAEPCLPFTNTTQATGNCSSLSPSLFICMLWVIIFRSIDRVGYINSLLKNL